MEREDSQTELPPEGWVTQLPEDPPDVLGEAPGQSEPWPDDAPATGEEPSATGEEPAATGEEPAATGEEPSATGEEEVEETAAADSRVTFLEEQLAAAERRVDELTAITRRNAEMLDRMHAELQLARQGETRDALAPIVRGITRLADDLDSYASGQQLSPQEAGFFARKVDEILHDVGVERFRPIENEDTFDPAQHQGAGSQPTDDAALDKKIAAVHRPGLLRDDARILRPAHVTVYRYVPPPAQEEPR